MNIILVIVLVLLLLAIIHIALRLTKSKNDNFIPLFNRYYLPSYEYTYIDNLLKFTPPQIYIDFVQDGSPYKIFDYPKKFYYNK